MNGSTKILTVSYGTFSCTLEGFDNPLSSMREIAEYFRDLAADDRYFGAEPPTPDVELLQNMAEKETQRRVEARLSDTGIALVATDAAIKPAVEKARPSNEQGSDDDTKGPLTFDDDFLMSDEPEDVLAVDPDAKPRNDGPAESVAEKLRRIRAVVSRSIEGEEGDSFNRQKAQPATGNDPKRDRALTETIQQITADLSDDEEASIKVDVEDAVEVEASEDAVDVDVLRIDDRIEEADLASGDDLENTHDMIGRVTSAAKFVEETTDAENITGDFQDQESEEDVLLDDDVQRTVSDVLGKITNRLHEDTDDRAPKERVVTRTISPEPEADVGRLLNETDSKLNEDETVRRRRVISQMRAAVAATKADRLVSRQVSRKDADEADKDPYREDLSEAVQDARLPEPSRRTSIAAPLMLVSSQRINANEESSNDDQTEHPEETLATSGGFAAFAESVGAKELHELLEAAAAYTVFAEGQPSFTRPEIMKRVARIDPAMILSREDGLRSFGQLLRQGKFKKLERGQFTIDEDTKFNPEQRFVGQ